MYPDITTSRSPIHGTHNASIIAVAGYPTSVFGVDVYQPLVSYGDPAELTGDNRTKLTNWFHKNLPQNIKQYGPPNAQRGARAALAACVVLICGDPHNKANVISSIGELVAVALIDASIKFEPKISEIKFCDPQIIRAAVELGVAAGFGVFAQYAKSPILTGAACFFSWVPATITAALICLNLKHHSNAIKLRALSELLGNVLFYISAGQTLGEGNNPTYLNLTMWLYIACSTFFSMGSIATIFGEFQASLKADTTLNTADQYDNMEHPQVISSQADTNVA